MANQANHSKIHLNWLELQEEGWHFQVFNDISWSSKRDETD
jgi:hypothetical protein